MTELIERADTAVEPHTVELSMQQAINRALRVLLAEDPDVLVFGEEHRLLLRLALRPPDARDA